MSVIPFSEGEVMRVLVTGGRDLDANKVHHWLCLNAAVMIGARPNFVIEGGAPGADWGAVLWRDLNGIPGKTFPADWKRHGRKGGPLRNAQMLREGKPDIVVAFPGGKGTADMVGKARLAGVRIIEVLGDFSKHPVVRNVHGISRARG